MKLFLLLLLPFGTIAESRGSKVLLISMDGFRWDYIDKANTTTNFRKFAKDGTMARYINPSFVTKTFPCHYTIATGLYEESHGIIANAMYDPIFKESFNMSTKTSKWWDKGEPLWVTVQHHGLHSGVYFWPGSEAEIRGKRPNIWKAYNETIPFETRVDTVVDWLSNTTYPIHLVMLYFHEPDSTGHTFGPDSPQVLQKVNEMDNLLSYIVDKLDKFHLWDTVNVIITSDHGMASIDPRQKYIDLLDHIDINTIAKIPTIGIGANIMTTPNMTDAVFENLSHVSHLTVYKRENIPEYWHYKNNPRVLDILAMPEEGWSIVMNISKLTDTSKGGHGYDNHLLSMKPIFYARGPNIKVGFEAEPFNSVDIYPLVCELLGIVPSQKNGTIEKTKAFIVKITSKATSLTKPIVWAYLICVSFLYLH